MKLTQPLDDDDEESFDLSKKALEERLLDTEHQERN